MLRIWMGSDFASMAMTAVSVPIGDEIDVLFNIFWSINADLQIFVYRCREWEVRNLSTEPKKK